MNSTKFIHAGELFVTSEPIYISTILGSCVSVCLYDPVRKISGMNHFLLPLWNGNGLQTPRFGNIAISRLIEQMKAHGVSQGSMQAKLFGGANIHPNTLESLMVGKKNVILAKEILAEYRIPIVAEDTGGYRGRKIKMDSLSGKIWMQYTQQKEPR